MNVKVDEDLARYVRDLISVGRYASEEDVIAAALRQMRDRGVKKAEIRRMMLEEASTDPIHLMS